MGLFVVFIHVLWYVASGLHCPSGLHCYLYAQHFTSFVNLRTESLSRNYI